MTGKKILVRQTRSSIRHTKRQKDTLKALGLGRIGKEATHTRSESVMGMLRCVSHLVVAREVAE